MRHPLPRRALPGVLLAMLAGSALAQDRATLAPIARIEPTIIAPNASTFTLPNGLQVVVLPDRRLPVVTHMVWYRVGSADEPRGKSGIAHFLEHLMFKGTERFPAGSFSRHLGSIGGRENAFTNQDYTGYYQQTTKQHLPLLMEFEADRMLNVRITEEVVAPEREVIIEERRQRTDNNPAAQFSEQVTAALYQHHSYRIPVIGWEHEMRGLTRTDALAFYERFYTPNNAVLIVAGDVTEAEIRVLAERIYGRVPARNPNVARDRLAEPPARAARRVTMTDARVQQPSWTRSYLTSSYGSTRDGTAEALDVLAEILGNQTGRVFRALVVEGELAASAGAWYSGIALDWGRFGFTATPRPGVSLERIEQAMDAVIAEVLEKGVTQGEVDRAINSLLASAVYSRDSVSGLARIFGAGMTTGSSFEDVREWPRRIARVTPESVHQAARRYFDPRLSVTGTLAPEAEQRPRS